MRSRVPRSRTAGHTGDATRRPWPRASDSARGCDDEVLRAAQARRSSASQVLVNRTHASRTRTPQTRASRPSGRNSRVHCRLGFEPVDGNTPTVTASVRGPRRHRLRMAPLVRVDVTDHRRVRPGDAGRRAPCAARRPEIGTPTAGESASPISVSMSTLRS